MASTFFTRFIPPTAKPCTARTTSDQFSTKKRALICADAPTSTPLAKRSKRNQSPSSHHDSEFISKGRIQKTRRPADSGVHEVEDCKESAVPSYSNKTRSTISYSEGIRSEGEMDANRIAVQCSSGTTGVIADIAKIGVIAKAGQRDSLPDAKKSPKKQKTRPKQSEDKTDIAEIAKQKHSKILTRFEQSSMKSKAAQGPCSTEGDLASAVREAGEPVIAQGLEPLPQPAPATEPDLKPTYSSLPAWLANPITASTDDQTKFADLGLDSRLLRTLEDHGYKDAFAVQSIVIPLLLPTPGYHSGDLCISAATGSGKTLAYVLPLVSALDPSPVSRLRGLIIVPTRELVKQIRGVCEMCSAGIGLRIGTAVGNVPIKDEQRTLMRIDSVYNPQAFKELQRKTATANDWIQFRLQDYIAEVEGLNMSLPGYVNRSEPNVDILICTPGRLVDHLRFTKGFTLHHVKWLVIDEADRLLNESFQEWVDVVINSLNTKKEPDNIDSIDALLSDLNLPIRKREPRKVVLSATMTKDISKLNSLHLRNPKLVVIGTSDKDIATEAGTDQNPVQKGSVTFTLPSTLTEFNVSVKDESKRPLCLLSLLLHHIGVDLGAKNHRRRQVSPEMASDHDDFLSKSSDESSSSSALSSDTESLSSSKSTDLDEHTSILGSPDGNTPHVMVFTKSSEAASRLSRLLSLLYPPLALQIGTIVKSNNSSASRKTLASYRQGKITIIIATDRASRGLDLPHLTDVINYDIPTSITTYVHRVGRTARAGNQGSAWTLVAHREGRWFSSEIAKSSSGKIVRSILMRKVKVNLENMPDIERQYEKALDDLEAAVKTEFRSKRARPKG